jgi:hypothetical protein
MSLSSHPEGKGCDVTVNETGLLSFMLGASETTNNPEVATEGIVRLIEVSLQEFIITGVALSVTTLPPCDVPKLEPPITTWLPMLAEVAETLLINGAGVVEESIETLSNIAVASVQLPSLATTNPI